MVNDIKGGTELPNYTLTAEEQLALKYMAAMKEWLKHHKPRTKLADELWNNMNAAYKAWRDEVLDAE